jgi:hypothetical protein
MGHQHQQIAWMRLYKSLDAMSRVIGSDDRLKRERNTSQVVHPHPGDHSYRRHLGDLHCPLANNVAAQYPAGCATARFVYAVYSGKPAALRYVNRLSRSKRHMALAASAHADNRIRLSQKGVASPVVTRKRHGESEHHDMIDGLRERAKQLEANSVELERIAVEFKKLADAAEPLYESLDDAQKRRFEPLLRKHVGLPDDVIRHAV